MGDSLRAISIHNPWAWAIVHGLKRVENRTWRTRHRGPLLIHASKSRRWLSQGDLLDCPYDELVYGAIIGVVDVLDCVPLAEVADDPFAVGPWCWLLANPRPVKPVVTPGRQGLFWVSLPSRSAGPPAPRLA